MVLKGGWLLLAGALAAEVVAQEGPPPAGHLTVGISDTLLFVEGLPYQAFGYEGPAPLFVQVWHPVDEAQDGPLALRELRERSQDGPLARVHQELLLRTDSAFIEYDLRYPLDADEPIDYAPFGEEQVLDSLMDLPTRSHRARMPVRCDAPVIVYHHGSQGLPDENVWMAEYFASRGYCFVSANFHWPLEGAMYGTPLVWAPDSASVHRLIGFARGLTTSDSVFYIGHSWGAQEGWVLLHEPGLVQAFVSLETTMEWKTDTVEVKDKWPRVYEALCTHHYPMPVLAVGDTEGEPPFPMFQRARADITYLDPKEPFGHESYTSAALLRSLKNDRFPQPDSTLMAGQVRIYGELLKAMEAFFTAVRGHRPFRAGDLRRTFHVSPPSP